MPKSSDALPENLASELRIAANRLVRRQRSQRGGADLPEHLFIVLTALNKFGAMTPGALADLEGVRPPAMTRTVNALHDLGFVTKESSNTDKRQVTIRLTETGAKEIRETRRRRDAWLTQRLGNFSHDDRQILAQASELLKRIAEQ